MQRGAGRFTKQHRRHSHIRNRCRSRSCANTRTSISNGFPSHSVVRAGPAPCQSWNRCALYQPQAANHACIPCIHRHMLRALGTKALLSVENHHNFAWKEEHGGREVIVHRKGATPAGEGVLGLIPGSMATPGFLVAGRGSAAALQSASHGAGRRMSRTEAKNTLNGSAVRKQLKAQGITLIGAGVDEAPAAYKDIHSVMENQRDLVDILGRFDPKIVRMAEAGERPED